MKKIIPISEAKRRGYVAHGVGKRKTSIARVWIKEGNGSIIVNGMKLDEYFPRKVHQIVLKQPLQLTGLSERFNIRINVRGGGETGQAEATKYAIAKAILQLDPEGYRQTLKKAGLLTRDARIVERKKYGRAGARKRFQYSKR